MADTNIQWPSRTAEYMHFDVTSNVNPLGAPVKVALPTHRTTPTDADYRDAEWQPDQTWTPGQPVTLRIFLAANTLTAGCRYDAWVQVAVAPETVELRAGADSNGNG